MIGIAALLAACERREPQMSDADIRLMRDTLPGMTEACVDKVRFGGLDAFPTEVDQCFEMAPAQRWRGFWRNDFEGSRFCPEPQEGCRYDTPGDNIWLSFSEDLKRQGKIPRAKEGGLYAIEFVGRRTKKRGGYGHFGAFDHEVVVDQLISFVPTPEQ